MRRIGSNSSLVGTGKTTAIKAAEHFCYECCLSWKIMWADTSFLYTAYTGPAASASAFGGCTTIKASGMFTTSVLEVQQMEWSEERIFIIDEILFMTEHDLTNFNVRLHQYSPVLLQNRLRCLFGYSFSTLRQPVRFSVCEVSFCFYVDIEVRASIGYI